MGNTRLGFLLLNVNSNLKCNFFKDSGSVIVWKPIRV